MNEEKNRDRRREEKSDSSESQKQESRLQEEILAGEWMRLNEFDVYRRRSRQGKIIATIQALENRIAQLERHFYQLVAKYPQKATNLLAEIKKLRYFKEYLLQCLIWEERGELDDHDIPFELGEAIL